MNQNHDRYSVSSADCNPQTIFDHLSENLSPEQQSEFEAHLSECSACRESVESQAADPSVWRTAARLLGETTDGFAVTSDITEQTRHAGMSVLESLAPTDDPEMLGRLGEYEISGVIGLGGMGAVLRGYDRSLRRVVAIKVMATHLAGSGPARHRFQREARAAAAITHDNVIDIYGVSEFNGLPYLVMPYARGPSLQDRIDRSGPMTATEIVRVGRQIALGLAAAHEQGLVHRDIKPANILLNEGIERLWITDFGVARAMDDASMTQTGLIAGTPQYMSPEQARGESVDHRSDLFSLGSILFTACTGRPPFRSEAAYGVLRRITDTDPTPIREINPEIPAWLTQIIERLMAKHPSDRYQTASEIAELFESCLAHLQQPTQCELPASLAGSATRLSAVEPAKTLPQEPTRAGSKPSFTRQKGLIVMLSMLLAGAIGMVTMQLTNPTDISGTWTGEKWRDVTLRATADTPGWYSGSFTDGAGQDGVIHLEWSRTQRRFNGRWQVGDSQSGKISLRSKRPGEITGAVASNEMTADPADLNRLWDITWQRSTLAKPESGSLRSNKGATAVLPPGTDRPTSSATLNYMASPISGRLTKLDESLANGSTVKKGQVLAEITATHSASLDHKVEELEQEVASAQDLLTSKTKELEVANESVVAAKTRVEDYKKAEEHTKFAKQKEVEAAIAKLDRAKNEIDGYKTELEQAESDLERTKVLFDKGLINLSEHQNAEFKTKAAKAKLDSALKQVVAQENTVSSKRADSLVQVQLAKTKTSDATSELNDKLAALAKQETDVVAARNQMLSLQNRLSSARIERDRSSKVLIVAPFDGTVQGIQRLAVGTRIYESQKLFAVEEDTSGEPILLGVKTSRVVTHNTSIARFQVDDDSILKATALSKNEVQLFGTKPGTTNVNLWDGNGTLHRLIVTVSNKTPTAKESQLRNIPAASLQLSALVNGTPPSGSFPGPAVTSGLEQNIDQARDLKAMLKMSDNNIQSTKKQLLSLDAQLDDLNAQLKSAESDADDKKNPESNKAREQLQAQLTSVQLFRKKAASRLGSIQSEKKDLQASYDETVSKVQLAMDILKSRHDVAASAEALQHRMHGGIFQAFNAGQATQLELMAAEQVLTEKRAAAQESKLLLDHYLKAARPLLSDRTEDDVPDTQPATSASGK